MARRADLCGFALVAVLGCGAPPVDAPSAVILPEPEAVCAGDGFRTPIRLDGSQSAPRLTLVPAPPEPGATPLRYSWRLSGADHRIIEGSTDGPELTVTTRGDRPLHVELTVEDSLGGVAVIEQSVGITLPDPASGLCTAGEEP